MSDIVEQGNAAYFDPQLSAGVLAALRVLATAPANAQALADRAFRLMRVARQDPRDFSARLSGSARRERCRAPGPARFPRC
ncbi:hypothetical protein [Gandjariella thermophila]|uniref:Uncharacterized protein n=1 Tax=Gandjariella thermophila TaxID=1931992 RepID=A0A4D4J021_9PSEU|nr:hypothetical protein [Gandjariella thermophila]GDY28500.1 hypothetical protein GTS_01330 [Gandjariella thermophila]